MHQADCAMLDHWALFTVASLPSYVVLPPAEAPVVVPNEAGVDLALQVHSGDVRLVH